jgi:hypothetical protein
MAKTNNFSIKFIQAVEKVLEENRLRLGSVKEEEILGDS